MIGKLGVFPHNLSDCSPLIVGDDLYVVTANGVDEGHINVPAPTAPSFIKVDKNERQGRSGRTTRRPIELVDPARGKAAEGLLQDSSSIAAS